MVQHMVAQFPRSEELRIAANNLGGILAIAGVWEIDVITQYLQDALGRQCALHKGFQRVQTLASLVLVLHFFPLVVILEGGEGCSEFGLGGVADHCQGAILQEVGDVAHIASAYLRVGVEHGGVRLGRVLQLDDAHGYAVHEEHHVGAAVLAALLHHKLVDAAEDVSLRALEVDVLHLEGFALGWCEVVAVTIEVEGVLQGVILVLPA